MLEGGGGLFIGGSKTPITFLKFSSDSRLHVREQHHGLDASAGQKVPGLGEMLKRIHVFVILNVFGNKSRKSCALHEFLECLCYKLQGLGTYRNQCFCDSNCFWKQSQKKQKLAH